MYVQILSIMGFGNYLKQLRVQQGLKLNELANKSGIDSSLISRIELDKRQATELQVKKFALALGCSEATLLTHWYAGKIVNEIGYSKAALESLLVAQEMIQQIQESIPEYGKSLKEKLEEIDQHCQIIQTNRAQNNFRIEEALEIEYTYHSNRIEGNTLTLQETDLVVNHGLTISGKSLREHLEANNHVEAIAFVKELIQKKVTITERVILQIHQLVLQGIDRENAGKYRNVPVFISGSSLLPVQPYLIPVKMEEFMNWFQNNEGLIHPVIMAALLHLKLVNIHPFVDGNGRTSRLIMNMYLLQKGYPLSVIHSDMDNRQDYYKVLELYHTQNKSDEFEAFIVKTVLNDAKKLSALLSGN